MCNFVQNIATHCKAIRTYGIKSPIFNTPERTRTSDLRFRKPMLYPTELRAQLFIDKHLQQFLFLLIFLGVHMVSIRNPNALLLAAHIQVTNASIS